MKLNRRNFLIKSSCALSMTALATQARHFGLMAALANTKSGLIASAPPSDYRALVCVFLAGGNDGNNMIIPNHNDQNISNYAAYSGIRAAQGLAIPQNQLLSITVPRVNGLTYGLHPGFGDQTGLTPPGGAPNRGIHELWAQGKLAAVTNVGNLVAPMTRQQYQQNAIQKPYQLFSHSDQIAQQQAGLAGRQSNTGFGGRLADRTQADNNPTALIPMITSIAGTPLFTNGQTTAPLAIASGNVPLNQVLALQGYGSDAVSTARRNALNDLRGLDRNLDLIRAASQITDGAFQASSALNVAVNTTVAFPNTALGNQLKQVARMIKQRQPLQVNRQIFFCSLGGFDTHTGQVSSATGGQNGLLLQLSQAMRAFYDEMGAQGAQDNVTLFTLSDFGRTLSPAGNGTGAVGSDHAWGNHALVMGGAVRGGDFYGTNTSNGTPFPTLSLNGPEDTDSRGRWIPTSSVDQYAATLARWYGLPDDQMPIVFPNISNFASSNLGFI